MREREKERELCGSEKEFNNKKLRKWHLMNSRQSETRLEKSFGGEKKYILGHIMIGPMKPAVL